MMRTVPSATLRVIREPSPVRDRLRSYRVLIDGEAVGRVRNGETADYPVSAGRHEVRLTVGIGRSPSTVVDVPSGGTVLVRCRAGSAIAGPLDIFRLDHWIQIVGDGYGETPGERRVERP